MLGRWGAASRRSCTCWAASTRPDAGPIALAGQDITRQSPRALARTRLRHVGFVFQSFHLIEELSGEENVLLPARLPGALRGGERRARRLIASSASPRSPAAGRTSSRAASSSGSRSPVRSSTTPRSCSPTSRPGTSTRRTARSCWPCSAASPPRGRDRHARARGGGDRRPCAPPHDGRLAAAAAAEPRLRAALREARYGVASGAGARCSPGWGSRSPPRCWWRRWSSRTASGSASTAPRARPTCRTSSCASTRNRPAGSPPRIARAAGRRRVHRAHEVTGVGLERPTSSPATARSRSLGARAGGATRSSPAATSRAPGQVVVERGLARRVGICGSAARSTSTGSAPSGSSASREPGQRLLPARGAARLRLAASARAFGPLGR